MFTRSRNATALRTKIQDTRSQRTRVVGLSLTEALGSTEDLGRQPRLRACPGQPWRFGDGGMQGRACAPGPRAGKIPARNSLTGFSVTDPPLFAYLSEAMPGLRRMIAQNMGKPLSHHLV